MSGEGTTLGTWMAIMDRLPPCGGTVEVRAACHACMGSGRVVTTDPPDPWPCWEDMPFRSGLAVIVGILRVIPCPECAAVTAALAHLTPGGKVTP